MISARLFLVTACTVKRTVPIFLSGTEEEGKYQKEKKLVYPYKSVQLTWKTNTDITPLSKFWIVLHWAKFSIVVTPLWPMNASVFRGSTNMQPHSAFWDFLCYDLLLNSNQIFWTSPSSAVTRTLKYNKFRIYWQASYFSVWSPAHLLGLSAFHQR